MKVYRYVVEGFYDPMHRSGHWKGCAFFVPAPYNIRFYIVDETLTNICRQEQVDDFSNDYFGFNPIICEVDLDEAIVKRADELLTRSEALENDKGKFSLALIPDLANTDSTEALNSRGIKCLKEEKYKEALELFTEALEGSSHPHVLYYNMACAYSLMGEKADAIRMLGVAVKQGYDHWKDIVADCDLIAILHEPEVVKIIDGILQKKPHVRLRMLTDASKSYIKRHPELEAYVEPEPPAAAPVVRAYHPVKNSWLSWLRSKV
jgi:tetratricopeptide (TPR) repeat protein